MRDFVSIGEAPYRGAGIEIAGDAMRICTTREAPYRGAGIEMNAQDRFNSSVIGSPLQRGWY